MRNSGGMNTDIKVKSLTAACSVIGKDDINSLQQVYELVKPPALECCGTPQDGKAKRRERRKFERLKHKKK